MARKSGTWVFDDATERDSFGAPEGVGDTDECILISDASRHYFDGAAWQPLGGGGGIAALTEPGVPIDDLVFSIDGRNLSSLDLGAGEWNDTVASLTGTITGTTMANGHVNFAAGTDRVDYGVIPAALEDLFAGGGTVSFWCRPESDGGGNSGRIIDTHEATTFNTGYTIYVSNEGVDDQIDFSLNTAGGFWDTVNRFPLNRWHHVVVTWDSDTPATPPVFTINGVEEPLVVSGSPSYSSDAGNNLNIGNRVNGDRGFDGDIEIINLYNAAKGSRYAREIYRSQGTRFGLLIGSTSLNATGGVGVETVGVFGADAGTASEEGGDVTIRAGTNATGAGSARGGNLLLQAGDSLANNGAGGEITIQAGDAAGSGNANGGGITIRSGSAVNNQGQGGAILIQPGDTLGGLNARSLATVTVKGGLGSPITGAGGDILLEGGDGNEGGGDVLITGGETLLTNQGRMGNVVIQGGQRGATGGAYTLGNVEIRAGTRFDNAQNQNGGDVIIAAGDTGTANQDGGNVTITAGSTNGFNQRIGGSITLTAGDEEGNGNSSSIGGDIVLNAGTSASFTSPGAGRNGHIVLNGDAVIFPVFTVAGVPDADEHTNGVIIVSDETGGRTLATSDGTDWRRVSDGAIIS